MPQWLIIGISGVTCGGKTSLAHSLHEYFLNNRNQHFWNLPYTINEVRLISQDDYFLPLQDLRHRWNRKLNVINFELLSSLDMRQLLMDIMWCTQAGRFTPEHPTKKSNYFANLNVPKTKGSTQQQKNTTQMQNHHINNHQHHSNIFQQSTMQQQFDGQFHAATSRPPNSHPLPLVHDNKMNILVVEGFIIFNHPELLKLCNIKFHFHLPYEKCYERRKQRVYDPPDVTGYFEICVWPHYEKNFAEIRDHKDIIILNGEINKDQIFKYVLQKTNEYLEEHIEWSCSPNTPKLLGVPTNNTHANMAKPCQMQQH